MSYAHFMSLVGGILITTACVALYLLPTLIGIAQRRRDIVNVFVLNLFLGWTGIGWAGVLIWVCIMPSSGVQKASNTPIEIAQKRYASGEISSAEYEEIKKNLT